ncbi:MAG TPA: hypothetical protein VM871_06160, partial [Flavisolibacter sp.]|nr:hypothetical protein [Flavisolibacter sp.]
MLPKLSIRRLLLYAISFVLLSFRVQTTSAQPAAPLFQVIHLPRKAGYSKQKLNAELAALTNKEAVKKLLKSKNFPPQTSVVIYINRPSNGSTYWTVNTSLPSDREDSQIILQSRNSTSTRFFALSEFKEFFRDTLAIIDTLQIELFVRDKDYPDENYVLSSFCGKEVQKKKIPFRDGKLIFTKELLSDCKEGVPSITIYNNNNPQRVLTSCKMVFLTTDQQEALLSMADFIKA